MERKKVLGVVMGVVVILALSSSGWIYNIVSRNSELVRGNEMATLQTTFVQQYGSGAVIQQLVSPEKVYAALWTDGEGLSHVSWNIGGLWATIWSAPNPVPTP